MNSKMTTKSQLSPPEPKRNKQKNHQKKKKHPTKQTTRTGTESQKWRSHGGLSVGRGEESGGKVQGIRSINGR